jgi:hypothetical protein
VGLDDIFVKIIPTMGLCFISVRLDLFQPSYSTKP